MRRHQSILEDSLASDRSAASSERGTGNQNDYFCCVLMLFGHGSSKEMWVDS